MTAPDVVTVAVVGYNSAADLSGCLAGLARQTLPRHRFDVVVVDNASTDGSAELVRTQFPWVRVVALSTNTGFTGGNNAAAALARGGRIALLNADAVPDPFWLEELLRAADAAPPGWAACSKVVFLADPGVVNSAGLELLRDGRGADRGFDQPDRGQFERREAVFAGCGAAVLLRVPDREPLFDPRLFLYCEDLDRGWRDRLAGRGVVYAPRSVVRHRHGAAGGSPTFWFYSERNRPLVALKNGDWPLAARAALTLLAKVPEAVVRSVRGPRTGRGRWAVTGAVVRALLSFLWHAPAFVLARRAARGGRCG